MARKLNYGNSYKNAYTNTPQTQKIPGRTDMRKNNAGGYGWKVDKWSQLDRFLILGTEGGTYYVNENKLTLDNVDSLVKCIQDDGVRVVNRLTEVSTQGRAAKQEPTLFALALCMKTGNDATRRAAYQALPQVCRIGTHMFTLAGFLNDTGKGWGRGLRNAVGRWYDEMDPRRLALQTVKYQQRNGFSHRDLIRLSHPSRHEAGGETDRILGWVAEKNQIGEMSEAPNDATALIWAHEQARKAESYRDIVALINEYGLPRESIPTEYLNSIRVWEALLDNQGRGMPMTALIRNLGKMTSIGVIKPLSRGSREVLDILGNEDAIRKSRVHPLQVLTALKTYEMGHGVRGKLSWSPVPQVIDALDSAFYSAFQNVEPTGKNFLLGIDVSGSMTWGAVGGVQGLTPNVASAAMAMVTARTERNYYVHGFAHTFRDLKITAKDTLRSAMQKTQSMSFGGTDCALPMRHAMQNRLDVDTFVVYTDSETWAGRGHPKQALDEYRQKMGKDARLVVVGMVSNGFTIADPKDAGMLDLVGFDAGAPALISSFSKGEI